MASTRTGAPRFLHGADQPVNALLLVPTRAFEGTGRISVVASTVMGRDVLNVMRQSGAHVLVIGGQRAIGAGVATVRSLRLAEPNIRIVVFGVLDEESESVAWAEAGVTACMDATASLDDLTNAIERAADGIVTLSPTIAAALFRSMSGRRSFVTPDEAMHGNASLTPRETQVLRLAAQGLSNKEIALSLGIGISTVKNHMQHIFRKLGVRRRGDAVSSRFVATGSPSASSDQRGSKPRPTGARFID